MLRDFWKRMKWVLVATGCVVLVAGTFLMWAQNKSGDGAIPSAPQFSAPSGTNTNEIIDSSLLSFSSNLPLVIVNSFGQTITRNTKTPV